MTTPRTTHFNEAELGAYLDEVFPETAGRFVVEQVAPMFVRMRMKIGPMDLRPGGILHKAPCKDSYDPSRVSIRYVHIQWFS